MAEESEEEEIKTCIENLCRTNTNTNKEENKGEKGGYETDMHKLLDDVAVGITCTLGMHNNAHDAALVTRARLKTYIHKQHQDTDEERRREKQVHLLEKITREKLAGVVRAAARWSESATSIEEEEEEEEEEDGGYDDELRARIANVSCGNSRVENVIIAVCDARKQKWREMFVEARVSLPRLMPEVEWIAAAQTGEQSVSGLHDGKSGGAGAGAGAGQVEIVLTVEGELEDVASLPAEKRRVRFTAGRRELSAAIATMRVVKDNLAALVAPK